MIEEAYMLVSKGAYLLGDILWTAYIRDFTVFVFVNVYDMFIFSYFFRTGSVR